MIVPAIALGAGVAFPDTPGGLALIVAAGAAMLVLLAALSATQGVFAVALYRYAADGAVTGGFPQGDLEAPFTKRRRGLFGRRRDG